MVSTKKPKPIGQFQVNWTATTTTTTTTTTTKLYYNTPDKFIQKFFHPDVAG